MNYENIVNRDLTPDPQYDYLFTMPLGKYNTTISLTEQDEKDGVRVLCREPYAQSLYNQYAQRTDGVYSKDLTVNQVYDVVPVSYNVQDKLLSCVDEKSGASIFVPLNEVKQKIDFENPKPFKVMISKTSKGFNYASVKKCQKLIDFDTLKEYLENGTDFDVVVKALTKGGFIASFNNSVDCFVPGAHAAANIIYDFNAYMGKTIHVVIDNYDPESNMFIVSHKKYIKKILPERVYDIEFGKKYKGVLTSNPTKYGIFVEFAVDPKFGSIFTGLVHVSELTNQYSKLKQGDEVEFYVSRIIVDEEKNSYKINLTFDLAKVDEENLMWQSIKEKEGQSFDFSIEGEKINITDGKEDGFNISVNVDVNEIGKESKNKDKVVISLVDVIKKQIGLSFV